MEKFSKWLLGGGFIIVWGITLAFLDWRAAVHADNAVASLNIASDAKVIEMDKKIDSNTLTGKHNSDDIDLTQEQLQKIGEILMRPPQ